MIEGLRLTMTGAEVRRLLEDRVTISGMTRLTAIAVAISSVTALLNAQSTRPVRTQWDAVYTEGQADRGSALYRDQCATCHALEDGFRRDSQSAPLLFGQDFNDAWGGETFDAIVSRMLLTMPPQPPTKQGKEVALSREQATDLLAYMLRVDGAPTGQTELPSTRNALSEYAFVRSAR